MTSEVRHRPWRLLSPRPAMAVSAKVSLVLSISILFCGDSAEAVSANRLALAGELGISDEAIILPRQVHGDRCLVVDEALMHLDPGQRTARLDGVDGVMSCLSGVCIGVSTADCIPVLLYDDEHHAAAAVHAGWRGTVQRIVEKAVRQMQAVYDTNHWTAACGHWTRHLTEELRGRTRGL